MSNRSKICLLLIAAVCMAACQSDFDEWNDTDQRYVMFSFNTDSLLSKVLSREQAAYVLNAVSLPDDSRLRITAYCYDRLTDTLVYSERILTQLHTEQQIKIRHLYKDETYRFVFVADVVKYFSDMDYYETWYQLGTRLWDEFYLYADERNDEARYDVVGYASMEIEPCNQTINVHFKPLTYNGFCVFSNLQSVDHLSGYVYPFISYKLSTLEWIRRSSLPYQFDYRNPNEDIVMPVSLSYPDNTITVLIRVNTIQGKDTVVFNIPNEQRRPFVITVDCKNQTVTNPIFY